MTVPVNLGKPWCCYCNGDGVGRISFINANGEVVDNPFCKKHMQVVCKHTIRLLKKRVNKEPVIMVEPWQFGYHARPNLPTLGELRSVFYMHASRYQQMIDSEHFDYAV